MNSPMGLGLIGAIAAAVVAIIVAIGFVNERDQFKALLEFRTIALDKPNTEIAAGAVTFPSSLRNVPRMWTGRAATPPKSLTTANFGVGTEHCNFFRQTGATLDVKAFEPKDYFSSGDEVFAVGSWTCTARATGKTFTDRWAMHFTVKSGKITFFRPYEDTAIVVAALRN